MGTGPNERQGCRTQTLWECGGVQGREGVSVRERVCALVQWNGFELVIAGEVKYL